MKTSAIDIIQSLSRAISVKPEATPIMMATTTFAARIINGMK